MTNTAQNLDQLPAQGPGDRLQAARISRGMTVEDVANRMHLSESILLSLEDNNFDDITAPIFVKGYLRAYARIVDVDENDIIKQYTDYYTDGDPPILSTTNTAPEINADDTRVKWVTWLIIIALIALLSAWWWNRYQQPAQPLSLDSSGSLEQLAAKTSPEIQVTESPRPLDQSADQDLMRQVQQDLAQLNGESAAATQDLEPQSGRLDSAENVSAEVVEPVNEPVDTKPLSDETQMAAPVVASIPEVETEIPSVQEGLIIVVNADTWADIKDADGNRLVRDLLRAGRTLTVDGRPPFQLFLGNGYGVSLTYQGKEIDISDQIRTNNTARVSIGQ